jgi:ligand-binding sensor domain-containing protein
MRAKPGSKTPQSRYRATTPSRMPRQKPGRASLVRGPALDRRGRTPSRQDPGDRPGPRWDALDRHRGSLARFDGVRFSTFAPPSAPELATISVRALLLGRDDGVLCRFKDGALERFAAAASPVPVLIRGIAEDTAGTIWVGAASGLFRLTGGALVRQPIEALEIYGLYADAAGGLWVPSWETGLWRLRDGRVVEQPTATAGVPRNEVASVIATPDGTIWVGSSTGVQERRDGRWQTHKISAAVRMANSVRTLLVDRHDRLWAGTWSGLAQLDGASFRPVEPPGETSRDAINALFEDREGNIWVGMRGRGLFMFAGCSVQYLHETCPSYP